MQQQILVTLNGSKQSEAILPHALALASATHSGITLLRTVTPPRNLGTDVTGMFALPEDWYAEEEAWTRRYLNRIAWYIREQGVKAHVEMLDGDPATNIISYAGQQPEVLMIAMASHGRETVGRWFLGSVATEVIEAMPKPVVVMHANSPATAHAKAVAAYQNIILPLDGSPRSDCVLAFAQPLIQASGASVTLFQVTPTSTGSLRIGARSEYVQRKAQQLRETGLTVYTEIPRGDPAELLRRLSMQQRDVFIIAAHREGIAGLVMKFIHHVDVPVLLVPGHNSSNTL